MSSKLWRVFATFLLLIAGLVTPTFVGMTSASAVSAASPATASAAKTKVIFVITCPARVGKIPVVSVKAGINANKTIKVDILFYVDGKLDKRASKYGYKLKKNITRAPRMIGSIPNAQPGFDYGITVRVYPYKKRVKPYVTRWCDVRYG